MSEASPARTLLYVGGGLGLMAAGVYGFRRWGSSNGPTAPLLPTPTPPQDPLVSTLQTPAWKEGHALGALEGEANVPMADLEAYMAMNPYRTKADPFRQQAWFDGYMSGITGRPSGTERPASEWAKLEKMAKNAAKYPPKPKTQTFAGADAPSTPTAPISPVARRVAIGAGVGVVALVAGTVLYNARQERRVERKDARGRR